ncbi:MAG: glycine zipper 2TM domain-containing protein [Gallionella sp.]|nr:glycine zipper 2TM domain-containing protein [Gallionella sp.]MDD4947215.1 glycine zipper 2TM domain-containing protein [Gallionella sp.]MDD5613275.1 glycine zipper 2TM domain-containing protein [Gallionella sp.]
MSKQFALLPLLLLAACANNPQGGAMLGGAVGGATGAAVGHNVGGRDGAIIGGAIGAAAGAAIGHSQSTPARQPEPQYRQPEPQYQRGEGEYRREHRDNGNHGAYRQDREHGHGHDNED